MSAIIGWLIASGYLASTLIFARSTLRRWQADPEALTSSADGGVERTMSALMALVAGIFWPATLALMALRDWLWKPADADTARFEQMQADREHWREQARAAPTAMERETAQRIVEALDDLIPRAK